MIKLNLLGSHYNTAASLMRDGCKYMQEVLTEPMPHAGLRAGDTTYWLTLPEGVIREKSPHDLDHADTYIITFPNGTRYIEFLHRSYNQSTLLQLPRMIARSE